MIASAPMPSRSASTSSRNEGLTTGGPRHAHIEGFDLHAHVAVGPPEPLGAKRERPSQTPLQGSGSGENVRVGVAVGSRGVAVTVAVAVSAPAGRGGQQRDGEGEQRHPSLVSRRQRAIVLVPGS